MFNRGRGQQGKMDAARLDETKLTKLVNEMGFPRSEAIMALQDTDGNTELAITKLCSGEYSPPPYVEFAGQESTMPASLSGNGAAKNQNITKTSDKYLVSKPPPYSKVCLESEMKCWEDDSPANFLKLDEQHASRRTEELRCSSCFDEIHVNEKAGPFNKVVKEGMRDYHYDCYVKTRGPRCAHCAFPLSKVDPDRKFSGQFIVYEGKKYHIECYEKYAGPRCSYCFNVIIESQMAGEFTGCWIGEKNKMFHEECFYKKKQSEERSKNS